MCLYGLSCQVTMSSASDPIDISDSDEGIIDLVSDKEVIELESDDEPAMEVVPETDTEPEEDPDYVSVDVLSGVSGEGEIIALGGPVLMDDILDLGDVLVPGVVVVGHPDGHLIIDIPPLAIEVPRVDVPVGGDKVPVFHVDHVDDDIGVGEAFDIAILEVSSPVVSVMDISSSDTTDSVSSSALRAVGPSAHATDCGTPAELIAPTTLEMGGPSRAILAQVDDERVSEPRREIPSVFEIGGPSCPATASPFIERFRAAGFLVPPKLETGGPSRPPTTMSPSDPCYRSPMFPPTLEKRIDSIEMLLHVFMHRIDRELDVIRQRRINDAEQMIILTSASARHDVTFGMTDSKISEVQARVTTFAHGMRVIEEDLARVRAALETRPPQPPPQ
ncbi:hypothetical protein HanIR_Chr13g0629061 [Helianthus annuus]|nr:hypothetical protein HanIR_Chr13g0629061 [Helianthus annuus]